MLFFRALELAMAHAPVRYHDLRATKRALHETEK
jgi:hypothetical protein